jgi:ADP-ribose pyrophosphatase YjhB (NUDIX family)
MNDLGAGTLPVASTPDDAPNNASVVQSEERAWGHDGIWAVPLRLPMIISDEVADLAAHYGAPVQRSVNVLADDYIYSYRFNKTLDRRAEVVFAIEDDTGQLWVHSKSHYPEHIFRLPTGGVHWDELVVDGLLREVQEETGSPVEIVRFLGMIEYQFWHEGVVAPFASYIFHLRSTCIGCPPIQQGEPISQFRGVKPQQMRQLAMNLRNLPGVRRAWGEWRALAHDLVYDTLLG